MIRFEAADHYSAARPSARHVPVVQVDRLAVRRTHCTPSPACRARPWFDRWPLTPGGGWLDEIVTGLEGSCACAIFFGERDVGDCERLGHEVEVIRAASDREFGLFSVLPISHDAVLGVPFGTDIPDRQDDVCPHRALGVFGEAAESLDGGSGTCAAAVRTSAYSARDISLYQD